MKKLRHTSRSMPLLLVVEGEICSDINEHMLCYTAEIGGACYHYKQYANGCDWHRTKEAAIARAKEMQLGKIASLEKQIAKLQTMKFDL